MDRQKSIYKNEYRDGKYQVIRELGRGGSGVVYLVNDIRLNCLRALKEIEFSNEENFERELMILKKIRSQYFPILLDCFREDEYAYLVMEYIEGINLKEYMQKQTSVNLTSICKIGQQIAQALKELHYSVVPIFYGDLKPSNIMIDDQDRIKLIDFGTACSMQKKGVGTKGYAAPEQYGAEEYLGLMDCGNESYTIDIFSLGVILHELLYGEKPYGEQFIRCEQSFGGPFSEENRVIEKCIKLNPYERYQSINHFIYDWDCIYQKKSHYPTFFMCAFLTTYCFSIVQFCVIVCFEIRAFWLPCITFLISCLCYMQYKKKLEKNHKNEIVDRYRILKTHKDF